MLGDFIMNSFDLFVFFDNLQEDNFKWLLFLLTTIMIVSVIDWLFGWTNAKFNSNVVFQSNIALYGIIKKMQYFFVLVVFMFVALLLLPSTVAFPSLVTLYVGYLLSELNSVLSHLGLTEDGKHGDLFINFIKKIGEGRLKKL